MSDFNMPPGSAMFEARGGWLVNRLAAELGLTKTQAAGIVGNLGYESVGLKVLQEMNPAVPGSKGGWGWAQWTGPRRRAFEAWCNKNSLGPASDAANFGFLLHELRGEHKYTITALKMLDTLDAAVFSVGQTYERPGGTTETNLPGFTGRLSYAERALAGAAGTAESIWKADIAAAVRALQTTLNAAGASLDVDGDLGARTVAAYRAATR